MRRLLPFAATAVALACGEAQDSRDDAGVVRFDSASVRIHTSRGDTRLLVELARTREQRTMGLMERASIPDSGGMLFLFERDERADAGFWMYRTRIPLDIAFIDSTGLIVAVRQMQPCRATLARGCPAYEPGVPYRAALEVNAGVLARNGIAPGSRIELPVTGAEGR